MSCRATGTWTKLIAIAALPFMAGCAGFFPPIPGGGGGGGSTGNYVYVANAGSRSVSGFSIGANKLTRVPNSPLPLTYSPVAMAITPSNSFLYVAGGANIHLYSINKDGSLTAPASGSTVAIANVVSLDVSPDGKWLFGLDGTQQLLDIFAINTSTGGLTASSPASYSAPVSQWVPSMVRISPNGALIFAALGAAGDQVFTFDTATGLATVGPRLNLTTISGDNGLAIDSNTARLYIARTGVGAGVAVYTIGTGGQLTPVAGSPFASGTRTLSVVLSKDGANVYAANLGDSTISGYAIGAGGALTPLAGSPYTSGQQVTALGVDSSGKYLLAAANGGSPDLTMYGYDATTPGKLDSVTSASTDTAPANAVAVALTH